MCVRVYVCMYECMYVCMQIWILGHVDFKITKEHKKTMEI